MPSRKPGPESALDSPSVCLIVLSWNGCEDTLACLSSLQAAVEAPDVILVDNNSTDDTVEMVRVRFPAVRIIQTGWNAGFAVGNNVGIQAALAAGYDVIGLINNDTTVRPSFLPPLLAHLRHKPLSGVSPRIEYHNSARAIPWFAAARIDPVTGLPTHALPTEADGRPYESQLLTGCFLMATRETWATVGLLDDRYFLTFEDSDWSIRARELGVELWVVPESIIHHRVSRSFERTRADVGLFYWTRNALLFATEHAPVGPPRLRRARMILKIVIRPIVRDLIRSKDWKAAYLRWQGFAAFVLRRWGPAPPRLSRLAEVRSA